MKVTADSYRAAASEHIQAAQELYESRHYVLAAYLSGLAVECLLRAYNHRVGDEFDARHDLVLWYRRSGLDAFVPAKRQEEVSSALSVVVSQWNNSQRYYSLELLRADWKSAGMDRGIKGDFVKERVRRLINAALTVVTIGEQQWKNSLLKSPNS